ncbi:MAG TPA: glycosyltransferase family 39 protein [Saprospiraceae bacterium]|nr:glycosyltransferase family 39 protein [Saprospiraceae bacterium]
MGLTFSICSYYFNKKSAYIAALLFSINGLIIELNAGRVATDHIDIFFLFFIELAIYLSILFVQKGKSIYNIFAGVSIGAAILSKWLPALIVLPIWLLLVIDSRKFTAKAIVSQFLLIVLSCLIIFLPWQLYIWHSFPLEANWEYLLNFRHITEVLDEQGGPFYYFLDRIRINYGELIYLPLAWFLWKVIKNPGDLKRLSLAIWFVIPVLFFSLAKTKMQSYILFVSPALFMMTAEFWIMLSVYRLTHNPRWLYNIILVLLIVLPIRYSIERTKPFDKTDRSPQWVSDLKRLNERHIKKGVMFNYDKPIEAMFYTNLTVYSYIPERKVLLDLIEKGYTILIKNDKNVTEEIKLTKGVVMVN